MLPVTLGMGSLGFYLQKTLVKTTLKVNETDHEKISIKYLRPACGNFSCALMGLFLSSNKIEQYINISVKFTSKPNFTGVQSDDNLDSAQFDTI